MYSASVRSNESNPVKITDCDQWGFRIFCVGFRKEGDTNTSSSPSRLILKEHVLCEKPIAVQNQPRVQVRTAPRSAQQQSNGDAEAANTPEPQPLKTRRWALD